MEQGSPPQAKSRCITTEQAGNIAGTFGPVSGTINSSCEAPAVETAFNAWYDTEHIPALARVPGVLSARRFRAAESGPKYVALYHLVSPDVVSGADWKRASESTPMPEHIRPQISDRLRLVCRSYHRRG